MNYIFKLNKNFDGGVRDKYIWGNVLIESKYIEKEEKYPLISDYFNPEYFMKISIQTGFYWGDFLFIGYNFLIKKDLYEKLIQNGFVNGYKTYKVINTEKGGPEYVGIVVLGESIKIPEKNITYVNETWGKSAQDFIGIGGMDNGYDFFLVKGVGGTYITEKLYDFLQENADVGNIEFKKIECV